MTTVYMSIPKSSITRTETTRWGTFHLHRRWGHPYDDWGISYCGVFIPITEHPGSNVERQQAAKARAESVFAAVIASEVDPIDLLAEALYEAEIQSENIWWDMTHWHWRKRAHKASYKRFVTRLLRQHYPDAVEVDVWRSSARLTFVHDGRIVRQSVSFEQSPRKTSIRFLDLWVNTRQASRELWVRYFRMRLKLAIAAEVRPRLPVEQN